MFLFHMPRSSIHPMPNSLDATSQTWPKSCEISSLITETWNGEADSAIGLKRDAAAVAVTTIPATKSRRVRRAGMNCSLGNGWLGNEGHQQSTTIERWAGSRPGCEVVESGIPSDEDAVRRNAFLDWYIASMCKSRLFLVLAIVAGMLCGLSMMISKNYVWAARLLIFPSLVGCLIFSGNVR